jgi:hypothetical protein
MSVTGIRGDVEVTIGDDPSVQLTLPGASKPWTDWDKLRGRNQGTSPQKSQTVEFRPKILYYIKYFM